MNSRTRLMFSGPIMPAILSLSCLTPVFSAAPREAALADNPLAYYELGVAGTPGPVSNSITSTAVGTSSGTRATTGVVVADGNSAAYYNGTSALTTIPYVAGLNPAAASSFSFEVWVMPSADGATTPQVIVSNGNQQGWKITQLGAGEGYSVAFYNGSSTASFDLSGGPYTIGFWSHIVVTYDGTAKTAKLYVDSGLVDTATNANYTPNASQAMTLGGDFGGTNLFTGAIDELAFYPKVLTDSQISTHFQGAFDSAPTQSYTQLVRNAPTGGATYYLRLDEPGPDRVAAVNSAPSPTTGNGVHFPGVVMQVAGALTGSTDTAVRYDAIDKSGFNGAYSTVVPYQEALNTQSFSAEAWVRPLSTSSGNNANLFRNHNDSSNVMATTDRAGWVVWQLPSNGGWSFRLYNRTGSTRAIDLNAGTYTSGQWQHLVFTFDYATRTAKTYINGALAGTQTIAANLANYVPLTREEGYTPSFGGFSDGRQNPFIGDMDEVAYYNTALTATQVQAHYANGTNAARTTPYETVIAGDAPVAYFRQNETPKVQVTNLGSLGTAAVGTNVNSPVSVSGPSAPSAPGFPAETKASLFTGSAKTYVELNNPSGLNVAGAMTLEAWIQPSLNQPASAYIIGHGGNAAFNEVFLRLEGGNYQVGDDGAAPASFAIPAGDLGGSAWIHLAGVWSNGTWTLYRNGVAVATAPDATGPKQIANANWAIGARGRWVTDGFPYAPNGDQRVFNGAIATAGIYNTALTQQRVTAHYNAGATLSPALSPLVIVQNGSNVTLTWTSGTLAQSTDLVNWTDVAGATSPYTTTASDKKFFRLHD